MESTRQGEKYRETNIFLKGPVVGPLVMAGCLTSPEIDERLKELGVKDSKLILPAKREQLFEEVKKLVLAWDIVVVSPKEIDAALNNPELNLNKLEAQTSLKIIANVSKQINKGFDVMLDSPTNTPRPYIEYVESFLEDKDKIKIKAETKADMNYISVGAGSILAKVTRDRLIEEMKQTAAAIVADENLGSGYPADPKTKEFLKKHWDKLDDVKDGFFRKSWASWKNVAKNQDQKTLF